jgi:DNA-binding response OmpR family regulator
MKKNKIKILVIEDEVDLLDELASLLRYENYEVLEAPDGNSGINLATEHKPALILCDIIMPGINGYDVLKKLRENPESSTIPFIFITALAEWNSLRQGMELGADDYIVKPFSRDTLLNAIKTRLNKANKSQQEINRLKNNIIYSVPHELQTPLNVIMGYCKTMKDESANLTRNEIAEMSRDIYESATRLSEVSQKFLMLADVELNKDRIHFSKAKIDKNIISKLAVEISGKYNRSDDLSLEMADIEIKILKDWFIFAISQMIDNAFKFSQPGEKVTVSTEQKNKHINIIISDHGRGFPPECVNKINAFTQFDREKYEQQGIGLGLYLAKQIIVLHDGEMTINTFLNTGSKINIKLPVS